MEAILFGIRTNHLFGQFCKRVISPNYFLSRFETPFLYERDDILLRGNAGDYLIIPPNTPVYHGPLPDAQGGFVNDWIYLQGPELSDLLERYPLPLCTAFQTNSSNNFRTYLEEVTQEQSSHLPGSTDLLHYRTGQLLIGLYRSLQSKTFASDPRLQIAKVREAILQHPELNWTLESMAQTIGYSVSRFSALYQRQYLTSPKQDLLNIRIVYAKKTLRLTNATVSETARNCGFKNIYYFSKYFKKVTGMTPSEYSKLP